MDYFDTLLRSGWLADPGERVRVVAIHHTGCLSAWGWSCSCDPRLELVVDPPPRDTGDDESDLPTFDLASGE
jgi:hypothetical protein